MHGDLQKPEVPLVELRVRVFSSKTMKGGVFWIRFVDVEQGHCEIARIHFQIDFFGILQSWRHSYQNLRNSARVFEHLVILYRKKN